MPLRSFGAAFLLVGLALLLTYALPPLREGSPFLLPLTAILLSVWYGGIGPGLLTGAAAAIVLAYLFLSPSYSLALNRADAIRLGVFLQLAIAWCAFITLHRHQDSERSRMLVRAIRTASGAECWSG